MQLRHHDPSLARQDIPPGVTGDHPWVIWSPYTIIFLFYFPLVSTRADWKSFAHSGFGTGIAQSAIFVALTAAVDKEHMAIASSGLYLFSSIGMVVGLATSSAVLECFLHKGLQVAVPRVPDRQAVIDRAIDDIGFVNGLEGELRRVIVGEYVRSLGYTHGKESSYDVYVHLPTNIAGISLMFSALGFFVSLFIRSHRL